MMRLEGPSYEVEADWAAMRLEEMVCLFKP